MQFSRSSLLAAVAILAGLPFSPVSKAQSTPAWSLDVSPSAARALAGATVTFDVTVTGTVPGPVTFAATGLPAGAQVRFEPPTLSGAGVTRLDVTTVGGTMEGAYTLIVNGTANGQTIETVTMLEVTHELPYDAATQLLLRFDGTDRGAAGEIPTDSHAVTYVPGPLNEAAVLGSGSRLTFERNGNFDATEGTFEAWVKPSWAGNDGQTHTLLASGAWGGVLFAKDGANNLRAIFNRFGAEGGVATSVASWLPGEWHHVAYTWSRARQRVRLFVDGVMIVESAVPGSWPDVLDPNLHIGSEAGSTLPWRGAIDELRISNVERLPADIAVAATAGALARTPTSVTVDPSGPVALYPTWLWWEKPRLRVTNATGSFRLPATAAAWSSLDPGVASVHPDGRVRGVAAGSTTVSASVNGMSASLAVNVAAPVRAPSEEPIAPYLAQPAAGALWELPTVIISYLPTTDGVNLDTTIVGNYPVGIEWLKKRIHQQSKQLKFAIEEGSRYHGYKVTAQMVTPQLLPDPCTGAFPPQPLQPVNRIVPDTSVLPSLGVRVTRMITVYEDIPPGVRLDGPEEHYAADYTEIFERFGIRDMIENQGVKHVWLYGWHHGRIVPIEFVISSPRAENLPGWMMNNHGVPLYDRGFVMLNHNFTRATSTHNYGHYIEGAFSYAAYKHEGHQRFFWEEFVGSTGSGQFGIGRAGWTHMPPNTTCHYDYEAARTVESDIMDWRPGGGVRTPVNAATWQTIPFAWPDGIVPDLPANIDAEAPWHIFWRQNIPGRDNGIRFGSRAVTNWWSFIGDFDSQIQAGRGLHELATPTPTPTPTPSPTPTPTPAPTTPPPTDGTGDFDGDGGTDLLWHHQVSGLNQAWLLRGGTTETRPLPAISDTAWHLVGVGDFNGDRYTDIVWRHQTNGQNFVWFMRGTAQIGGAHLPVVPDLSWRIVGVGNFDEDPQHDLLWRQSSTGALYVWFMRGTTKVGGAPLAPLADSSWHVVGAGHFDGDGRTDILWRHQTTGANYVWYMRGTERAGGAPLPSLADVSWSITTVGDFDTDGQSDIAWRNLSTGANYIWLMNGAAMKSGRPLPTLSDLDWRMVPSDY
jgi:hypothetical protein